MNFLEIILDDVGVEAVSNRWGRGGAGTYGYPSTPNIDAICDGGMRFNRSYARQLCSPFRAAAITGRQGQRTGVLDIIRDDSDGFTSQIPLQLSERTLAHLFKDAGYATGAFGKWHLGNTNAQGRRHPNLMGFDEYAGNLFNLDNSSTHTVAGASFREGYRCWDMTRQGTGPQIVRTYHTTHVTNLALRWIRDQSGPWYCYVAFYAVHSPFGNSAAVPPADNAPPTTLYDSVTWSHAADTASTTDATMHSFRAGQEAVDHEIGRLLAGVDLADTIVCFCSDNGSPVATIVNEVHPTLGTYTTHGKDSPYETGIWCPMAWMGPGISTGTHDGLTAAEDIFSTAADLFDLTVPTDRTIDGISFAPVLAGGSGTRTFVYTEFATPLQGPPVGDVGKTALEWACVGPTNQGRYALVRNGIAASLEFYDLLPSGTLDPMQATNLTPAGSTSGLSAPQLSAFNQLVSIRAAQVAV